jgi:hypothetical protein
MLEDPVQKFAINRDDSIYEVFPDVALTPSGKLICTFAECTHHGDRSPTSDTGYSGWVQFADNHADTGEIYVVNYIPDDAPKAQIRSYSLRMEDFLLE